MDNNSYTLLAERIKKVRTDLHLTQQEFADRISVSRSFVSRMESGKEKPSNSLLKLIALEFDVSTDWLENGQGTMEISNLALDYFDRSSSNQIRSGTKEIISKFQAILSDYNMSSIDNSICALIGELETFLNYYSNTNKNIGALILDSIISPMLVLIDSFSDVNEKTTEEQINKRTHSCIIEILDALDSVKDLHSNFIKQWFYTCIYLYIQNLCIKYKT